MPLFFTISGMFAIGAVNRPWRVLGRSKVARFLYLYAVWLLIHTVLLALVPDFDTARADGPLDLLAQLTITPSNLWYLYALALYFAIAKAARRLPAALVPGRPWRCRRRPQPGCWKSRQPRRRVPEPGLLPGRAVLPAARRAAGRHREPAAPGGARRVLPRGSGAMAVTGARRLARRLAAGLRRRGDPRRDGRGPGQPMGRLGERAWRTRTRHPAHLHHPHAVARAAAPGAPPAAVRRHGRQATAAARRRRTAAADRTRGVAVSGPSPGTPEERRHLAVRPS